MALPERFLRIILAFLAATLLVTAFTIVNMVCVGILCNGVAHTAETPQHRLPVNSEKRKEWIKRLRKGDQDLNIYLNTHENTTKELKCCRSHFRLED